MKEDKKHIALKDIKKANVHQVPDQYFSKLNADVRQRIDQEKDSVPLIKMPIIRIGTPIAVAAMAALVYFFVWSPTNDNSFDAEGLLAEIQTEEIINYLDEIELSEEDILASVDMEILAEDIDGDNGVFGHLEIEDQDITEIMEELDLEDYNF